MERKVPLMEGEIYHIYSRGVEKRLIFMDENDFVRFTLLLLVCNSKDAVHLSNSTVPYHQGESLMEFFERHGKHDRLTNILAYSLMPNHFHIVVKEKEMGGTSKFMLKLMTGYSMYFNVKNDRSGPLFTRPFRSRHVDSDHYLRWVFSYVLLNPLDMLFPGWKENGIPNLHKAGQWIKDYRHSSYFDYFLGTRPETAILAKSTLPINTNEFNTFDSLLHAFIKQGGGMLL